jgi:hypothetical protein
MTLWHHLTGFFTLPVYLITITCHSIYDSIHCFGIIAVQSHSLDSPDEQKKKIKIKCYFKKTNEKLDDAMSHTFTKTFFFLSSLPFNLIIFSFSTPQTMGGHPEQIFAFCYESINQFIHASHSFHFHFFIIFVCHIDAFHFYIH